MALILVCTWMVKKSLLEWLCFLYIPIHGFYYSGLSQKLQGFLSLFLWICRIDLYQNEKAPFSVPPAIIESRAKCNRTETPCLLRALYKWENGGKLQVLDSKRQPDGCRMLKREGTSAFCADVQSRFAGSVRIEMTSSLTSAPSRRVTLRRKRAGRNLGKTTDPAPA